MVTFVVKLRGKKTNIIFYKELPLNENDNNFDGKLNDINYKITVMNLHNVGRKKSFTLMMMFLCLVMYVVCLIVLNFMIEI